MTTKRNKTAPAHKSAKKTPKSSAPRKRTTKATAPVPVPDAHDAELVHYVHKGNTYELERVDGGYRFSGQTFKSLTGFGKHLEKLDADSAPAAAETDALLEHVETTLEAAPKRSRKAATSKPRDPRLPAVGTVMKRSFKGREIEVKIINEGFEYEGDTYRSVSALARHITGYSISGPVFFRLVEPKVAAKDGE